MTGYNIICTCIELFENKTVVTTEINFDNLITIMRKNMCAYHIIYHIIYIITI
jgi:hypothetical protein